MTRNRSNQIPTNQMGKVPPQAPDMEEAVIAAAILERDALELLLEIISEPEVFYVEKHRIIFKALRELYVKGSPVDLLTVTEQLRKTNQLDLVGGAYELTKLTMAVLSTAHIDTHARIVLEKHLGRELIRIGHEAIANGYDESIDVFTSMDKTELRMYELSSVGVKKRVKTIAQVVNETISKLLKLKEQNVQFTGINTGFPPLNDITGGWQPTDLIIIAARPSVGKTAFAINTKLGAALDPEYGGPVALFSLEMSQDQVTERMLSCISGVPLDHIRKPHKMQPGEMERVIAASQKLSQLKMHIDDTAGLTSMELRTKARKLVSQDGVKMIIIDYLQLMECDKDRGENREQQISKISRDLKKLAKDLHIPVIALSQMTRNVDTQNRAPQLSDLRESGAIEQDADLVMFLYRPTENDIKKEPSLAGKVLGSIKKHRNGELGQLVFDANNKIQRWTDHFGFSFANLKTPGELYKSPLSPETTDDLPF